MEPPSFQVRQGRPAATLQWRPGPAFRPQRRGARRGAHRSPNGDLLPPRSDHFKPVISNTYCSFRRTSVAGQGLGLLAPAPAFDPLPPTALDRIDDDRLADHWRLLGRVAFRNRALNRPHLAARAAL